MNDDKTKAACSAVLSSGGLCVGDYVRTPPLRQHPNALVCPICGKTWLRDGRGQGFVKAGAFRHVVACWRNALASQGLAIGKWDEDRDAHILTHNAAAVPTKVGHERHVIRIGTP